MPFKQFHAGVESWFQQHFSEPSDVQKLAWPSIKKGQHTLLAAPTGSGKTLASFLAVIDDLMQEGINFGLPDETRVVYISPLKALSNDIEKNLKQPLMEIRDELLMQGLPDVDIRVAVRTGDTPNAEREKMRRKAPHILVTTPESLFILLTSKSGRKMLSNVRSVIVDEIHAMAGDKRGAHLMLSLERLTDLSCHPLVRIGISATQKPIETMASYLIGNRTDHCEIVDTGHTRDRDLAIEVPSSPLEAIMSNEVWEEIYDRLAQLCSEHSTTLIFVNTRRLAERAAKHLAERLGEDSVTSHHGSLAREHRLDAETRLKNGSLRALVATASLELGIDIGDIDLVCQLGSPGSIAVFLQRVGRSGHALYATPKGRLFPLTRDDLVEAAAIMDAVRRGELDQIGIPDHPMDILAQHIVAEVANEEWSDKKLYRLIKRAWPYREVTEEQFSNVVRMLSEGYTTRRGRRGAHIHHDRVNHRLRDRRGARLVAITNGGAIPDLFDYDVVLSPHGYSVGSLNEDFAFESLPGDIFQLGNTSYRILKIETGKVHVEDAHGQPPNIPFWFGEAPGRTDELSLAVSRLRGDLSVQLEHSEKKATDWIQRIIQPGSLSAAEQLANYIRIAKSSIDGIPTQKQIIMERFFDETGDMHLVIHSSFGSRINRAWGLALRKRFCRKFNFELQAAALEDSIILSLGATHSFPLDEVSRYLNSKTVRHVLIQALLDAPMFETHWRWVATISLAIQRNRNGKKVPPQFQRNDSEDLIALVFPDQIACLENIAGEREVPDHPLVNQTLYDCLNEVMDISGLESLLKRIEKNEIEIICRDLTTPSVLSQEILNARPFAFLDDTPAEERRTLAVKSRRYIDSNDARNLSLINPDAITKVQQEAWPLIRNSEELHDALTVYGFMTEQECLHSGQPDTSTNSEIRHSWLSQLSQQNRAARVAIQTGNSLWVSADRLAEILILHPEANVYPQITGLANPDASDISSAALAIIRSRLQLTGPITSDQLTADSHIDNSLVDATLLALEQDGFVMRGMWSGNENQWCERGLLARINRYSLQTQRKQSIAVPVTDYLRFLFQWHGCGDEKAQSPDALPDALQLLTGYPLSTDATAQAMQSRLENFRSESIDEITATGQYIWFHPNLKTTSHSKDSLSRTQVVIIPREELQFWIKAGLLCTREQNELSSSAVALLEFLEQNGASFFVDIVAGTGQLRTQTESALSELISAGLVHSDSFAGLRALAIPPSKRPSFSRFGKRSRTNMISIDDAGRWNAISKIHASVKPLDKNALRLDYDTLEYFLSLYLNRYGVVFRKLLERESILFSWRDLLPVLQRLEARGEILGGRFVDGFSGIQFALPEAAAVLKSIGDKPFNPALINVSSSDPLNLTGTLLPGKRFASSPNNKIFFQNGAIIALQSGDDIDFQGEVDEQIRQRVLMQMKRTVKLAGKRFRL